MATWSAIKGAATYSLDDGNPFYFEGATGVGVPPSRRLFQQGPMQHGHTDKGFRYDPGYLFIALWFDGASLALADTARDLAAAIFKPQRTLAVKIHVVRDDGALRRIDTHTEGIVDLPAQRPDRLGSWQRFLVRLKAPDPLWYDPTLKNFPFVTTLTATEGFQIPMVAPFVQEAGDEIDATETIAYAGDEKEYPVIRITGPGNDAVITNVTTDEKLDFTGQSIPAGDFWEVDCRFDYKTVKNAAGEDVDGFLTDDSDLATFHLAADPEAADGNNDIQVQVVSGATTATKVSIQYYDRYSHL